VKYEAGLNKCNCTGGRVPSGVKTGPLGGQDRTKPPEAEALLFS